MWEPCCTTLCRVCGSSSMRRRRREKKLQAPRTKLQRNINLQAPNFNCCLMKTEPVSELADPRAAATAYALDELSAGERAAFEQQIESDSGLAALADETKEFCG